MPLTSDIKCTKSLNGNDLAHHDIEAWLASKLLPVVSLKRLFELRHVIDTMKRIKAQRLSIDPQSSHRAEEQ